MFVLTACGSQRMVRSVSIVCAFLLMVAMVCFDVDACVVLTACGSQRMVRFVMIVCASLLVVVMVCFDVDVCIDCLWFSEDGKVCIDCVCVPA
jgi:hypothetical protein